MLILKKLSQYTPKSTRNAPADALFLQSENGEDWYKSQKAFQPDTLKIVYDEKGIIDSFSYDVSTLWPINLNVAEVADVPKDIRNDRQWMFDGKKITPRVYTAEEHIEDAERRRVKRMEIAEAVIAPLVRAQKHELASDKELQRLTAWEHYSVKLSQLDTSKAPNMVWPVEPSI